MPSLDYFSRNFHELCDVRDTKSDVKNVEWGENLQVLSLQMSIGFSPVRCIFAVILLLICPLGVHSCVRVILLLYY